MDITNGKESKQTIYVSFVMADGEFSDKFKSLQPDHVYDLSDGKETATNWFVECKLNLSNLNNKKLKFEYDQRFSKSFMLTTNDDVRVDSFV